MMAESRESLIKLAEQKYERDQLIAAAEAKYKAETTPKGIDPSISGASPAQTFVDKTLNTVGLNYLPEARAAIDPLVTKIGNILTGQKIGEGDTESFAKKREYFSRKLDESAAANPKAAIAGTVAGIGAGLLIPGASAAKGIQAAKGASLLAKAGIAAEKGAKAGALYGLASNPTQVEGQYDPINIPARIENSGVGLVAGGLLSPAVQVAGAGLSKLGGALKGVAERKAVAALEPTRTQVTSLQDKAGSAGFKNKEQELGRTLLNEGAIPVLGTPRRIQGRVEKLQEKAGEAVGSLVKSAGDKKVIDTHVLADEIASSPELSSLFVKDPKTGALLSKVPGAEGLASKVTEYLQTLRRNGTLSVAEAQKFRQAIDKQINFAKRVPDMAEAQQFLYQIRSGIADKMNGAINALQGNNSNALKEVNKSYSLLSRAGDILDKSVSKSTSNRSIGLTDTIAAAAGAATGKPVTALALGAINKFGRTFGSSIQARSADALANAISKTGSLAQSAAQNPAKFQGAVSRILGVMTGRFGEGGQESDASVLDFFKSNPEFVKDIQDPLQRRAVQMKLGQ